MMHLCLASCRRSLECEIGVCGGVPFAQAMRGESLPVGRTRSVTSVGGRPVSSSAERRLVFSCIHAGRMRTHDLSARPEPFTHGFGEQS
jgi:hypothetical protein